MLARDDNACGQMKRRQAFARGMHQTEESTSEFTDLFGAALFDGLAGN